MGAPPNPAARTNASSAGPSLNSHGGRIVDPSASSGRVGLGGGGGGSDAAEPFAWEGSGAVAAAPTPAILRTDPPPEPRADGDDNDDPAIATSQLDSYLSLIQQYLALFMVDNATFLAERCVAEHPRSPDAAYLLALCHYRAQNPKRARIVLDEAAGSASSSSASSGSASSASASGSGPSTHDDTVRASIRFLSAVCSYELHDYSRAEDALLADCRLAFLRAASGSNSSSSSHPNNAGAASASFPRSMDDWIVQTTPCPVPNGAAGLALLGKICRKSNRRERAVTYFQMSLQLDPFLWSSFEALCELGVTDLDPADVFGVRPGPAAVGSGPTPGNPPQFLQGPSSVLTPLTSHAFNPSTGPSAATPNAPAAYPAATMLRTRGAPSRYSSLETSGLTPIPGRPSSFASPLPAQPERPSQMQDPSLYDTPITHHRTGGGTTLSSFFSPPPQAATAGPPPPQPNLAVMKRARVVVSRSYYPPSPDTASTTAAAASAAFPGGGSVRSSISSSATPVTSVTRSLRYLRGLGAAGSAMTAATPSSASATRASSVGRSWNPALDEGATTGVAATGGRSLFVASENRNRINASSVAAMSTAAAPGQSTSYPSNPSAGARTDGRDGDEADMEKPARDAGASTADLEASSASIAGVLEILSLCGAAYQRQCQFQCHAALDLLSSLPDQHQDTGWVLHQKGRAYLELNQFHEARKCLESMRSRDSGRMRGLELLSTVYWQLKKEVELAHLSQHAVDLDRLAPEAWCVVGNCFSLQKDHEAALVFFKRSLQLDYDFTYTHTLCGYEFMANEDFDKATASFRQALRIDERHYNAWYGLGAIYHKQEKYDVAEYHFAKAVSINPSSSVLRCNLGIAQNANGKPYQALETLNSALRLDPRNPQAMFQRASIYLALNQSENALEELRKVRDAAPREATIHFVMGRVLKKLGRLEEAMKCFLTAMDLDPKDNQMIKSAMDKLDEPDVDEEATSAF